MRGAWDVPIGRGARGPHRRRGARRRARGGTNGDGGDRPCLRPGVGAGAPPPGAGAAGCAGLRAGGARAAGAAALLLRRRRLPPPDGRGAGAWRDRAVPSRHDPPGGGARRVRRRARGRGGRAPGGAQRRRGRGRPVRHAPGRSGGAAPGRPAARPRRHEPGNVAARAAGGRGQRPRPRHRVRARRRCWIAGTRCGTRARWPRGSWSVAPPRCAAPPRPAGRPCRCGGRRRQRPVTRLSDGGQSPATPRCGDWPRRG